MATLSLNEIRARAARFANDWAAATNEQADKQTFWDDFFKIFGVERRSVAVYEKAINRLGRAKGFIDLFWPGMLIVEHKSLGKPLDAAYNQAEDYVLNLPPSDHPRYIITSDFREIRLYDLNEPEGIKTFEIFLTDLPEYIDMFSFIAGYEKQKLSKEDPVNRRAAEKLATLHDQLKKTGYSGSDLEILLVRLLFCLFGEDSNIFQKSQFHDFINNRTEFDGSDLGLKLTQLFETLNKPLSKRQTTLDESITLFPYVNGHLFERNIDIPTFDYKARDMLLATSHQLDWSQISPAIFGAMFQGVMDKKARRSLGAHYTSETNILKVIKPLFLDDLQHEFEEIKNNHTLLTSFHNKLARLTFMDPACGCGNFLVVAYRELRRLELEVLKILYKDSDDVDLNLIVKCNVDQFYGIEIEAFPAHIAQVAMWLTDTQMNNEATDVFGKPLFRLPLTRTAKIFKNDALILDWRKIIDPKDLNYLFGNPPFSGGKLMSQAQRNQIVKLFNEVKGAGVLDFVAGWYAKAIDYIKGTDVKVAFVSTNSITQGEQVGILWPFLISNGAHINFAHRTFKWSNDASGVAGVYCVIIGFWLKNEKQKQLFEYPTVMSEPHQILAKNINPYLVDAPTILIKSRSDPLSDVPSMDFGNMPNDDGAFLLMDKDRDTLIKLDPLLSKYIKPFISAKEFLNGQTRWCIWLIDAEPSVISRSSELKKRIAHVREHRLKSSRKVTRELAKTAFLFGEIRQPHSSYILIPRVSSEARNYIPIGFFDKDSIVSDTCMSIPHASLYHFGVLTSQMHMAWVRAVCGRLENRYRYSKDIVYNNFVWPRDVSVKLKSDIEKLAQEVLDARKAHPESTLADLYDPLTMPQDLMEVHSKLDHSVDNLYTSAKFSDDTERISFLFEKYAHHTRTQS